MEHERQDRNRAEGRPARHRRTQVPSTGSGTVMGISATSSIVYLPDTGPPYPTLLDFFAARFPKVPVETWSDRIAAGKVLTEEGLPVTPATPYLPDSRLFYFREVAEEPQVPFTEEILYRDDHLLVADKPHFLPVTASGPYVRETLLERLKARTENPELSPINRIDRETAGLVLFSTRKATRGAYQLLFMQEGAVRKTYEAIVEGCPAWGPGRLMVENRLEPGEPWFRMKSAAGPVNARTEMLLLEANCARTRIRLFPLTGKKHQLRLHLAGLGHPIVHDRLYPELSPQEPDDFARPLQLLSLRIEFRDPLKGTELTFESLRGLASAIR